MSKNTHKLMLGHSQAKVELYGRYLTKYLRVITQDQYTTDIHIYDLFSGEGIYDGEGKGSPIVALSEVQKLYNTDKPLPTFHFVFNDIDKAVITKLKENVKSVYTNAAWKINYCNQDYLDLLPSVISEISKYKNEKAIIFLDPKGYKEIKIGQIKSLLQSGKTEVLLFLPIRDMFRFANMDKESTNAGHEPLQKFMTEIFPEGIPRFNSQIDFIYKIRTNFKIQLPDCFVDTFIIERDSGQFFCLFFFTTHIRGFEKMLEAKWEIDEEEGRIWRSERTESMFDTEEVLDITGKLRKIIGDKKCYNGDLYSSCLHEGFLPKHATEILSEWHRLHHSLIESFTVRWSDCVT